MRCPSCSQEIPINQQYCPFCGKRVDVDFDEIQKSVIYDASQRRGHLLETVLINVIGGLVVLWVGIKLYNGYCHQETFPADRSGALAFSAPAPDAKSEGRLTPEIKPPVAPMPEIDRLEPRGMSWRRDPFREELRRAGAGAYAGEAAAAVANGLKYLAGRQQPDGCWLIAGTEELGLATNDWGRCGVTALACLAFLGDGHVWDADPKDPYAQTVRRGINYLTVNQDAKSGRIGPKEGAGGIAAHYTYNQGMATAALAEAYAMTGDPYLHAAAQKAVNYVVGTQQKSGGWDYYETPSTRADSSVTVWQLMALYSGQQAGLEVPAAVFEKGLAFIDSMTDPETFRVGYDRTWSPAERVGQGSTAIGLMLQLYLGRSASSAPVRRQARILMGESAPEYDPKWPADVKAEKLDYYYLYHATMAFQRLGGTEWETWNKRLVKTLQALQDKNGCWPIYDKWGKAGGKSFTTAMAVLTLEVYYRYQ